MSELNDEQCKLVEDNMNLVYHTIHQYYPTYIGDSEIVSSATFGLCKAAMTWDNTKSTFANYAIVVIRNAIRTEFKTRQRRVETVSIDQSIGEDITLGDILGDVEIKPIDYSFMETLTEDERTVFYLRYKGLEVEEIMAVTNFNRRKVRRVMRYIKAKYYKVNGGI